MEDGICERHRSILIAMLSEFVVGQQYTNDQIGISLQVENLGGIRPSVDASRKIRHIAVVTKLAGSGQNILENPYQDRIEQNILVFTGQGKAGDQTLTGRNKRITEQFDAPVPLYCFESCGRQLYVFRGLLELLRHYFEMQIDSARKLRKVLVFEFRIHSETTIVPIDMAADLTAAFLPENRFATSPNESERAVVMPELEESGISDSYTLEVETIRSRLFGINPYRFEHLLKDLVEKTGFRDVSLTPRSQDGGIDLNAYVGSDNFYFANTLVQFQAKRWRHSVGSVEINGFRGAISSMAKGVFVTTSNFTRAAIQEAKHPGKPSIALIDGFLLASMIKDVHLAIEESKPNAN